MSLSRHARRMLAPPMVLVLLPLVGVGTAAPAQATTGCPSAAYGVHRTAPGLGKTIALTFDDGPGGDTGRIRSILAANHVTATFFNLGVNEAVHRTTVRLEHDAGYALGDHTWDHRSLPGLSAYGQAREMDRERAEEASITGAYPCLFRPPYGSYNSTTLTLAQRRHMQVWNWSVDTEDWKAAGSGATYWINRITSRADAGASQRHPVILMHNQPGGNPATVAALPRIISYYRARGYRFVDLLGNTGRPYVRSVSPVSGRTAGGTRVAVTGSDFRHVSSVRFGSSAGTSLRVASPNKLYVTSPKHAPGTVGVQVLSNHGNSVSHYTARFRYVSPPAIASVSPSSGRTAGGTRVRVDGTNLTHVTRVQFGTLTGTSVRVVSTTRLYVTAPAHAAGTVGVKVSTAYGASAARLADHFTYVAPPTVTAVAPNTVPTAGGTQVSITGSGIRAGATVTFGGIAGQVVSIPSSTQLIAVTTAHVAATVDVRVSNGYGSSAVTTADQLTYADAVPPGG